MADTRRRSGSRVHPAVLAVNAAGAAAAAGFGAVGLLRPTYVQPGSAATPLMQFWAACSAVRSWAIAVPLLWSLAAGRRPAPQLLVAAGLVQLGDAVLGLRRHDVAMTVAPAAMGAVHVATAVALASGPQLR